MKCAVVQDLLPIYCDGACSPETSAEIEKHTADCPVCSSLLRDYKSEVKATDSEGALPKNPFQKIKKSIFRSKLAAVLLAAVLIALVSAVCCLGYGQIVKDHNYQSFETVISSFRTKKLIKKLCSGDIDYVMDRTTVRNDRLFYYDGYLVPDEYTELRRGYLESYYNMIKDKKTDIKPVMCEYNETLNDLKFVHSMISVKTDGLPAVRFEIMESGGKYIIISCFIEGAYYETDEFSSLIEKMHFMLDPNITHDFKFEKIAINAGDQPKDLFMSRNSIVGEQYSDHEFENEAYSTALLERMYEMNQAGIYCDDLSIINSRFDRESRRFLADIYAVFTDPVTQNKIVYIRTIQWTSVSRKTVLDEFEPTVIDGGVSTDTLEKVRNLF
ncbi:MAG: zf-HC2 domain-containing protein [Oscillospiraceae bacterium]|nr:zf-HC2 domain-containing protein [Oscillospiraceae bacterium]